ncbi:MAG: Type II secretory pathway, pullulanase PulA [Rhodobacteraceae bacterium PARR1]|nr:MAG: Type II secretory pathway, pullulanase PulA [Rhodobacteraceae bacterium PARR1]
MIISPSRRFVFVHIPKTGGTALTLALESRARADDILIGDTPKAKARKRRLAALSPAGRLWKHSTLADVAGVVPEDLTGWCIVTLIRNPWDRVLSYYHWLRAQSFDHPAVHLAKSLEFSAFLNDPTTRTAFAAWPAAAYTRDAHGVNRVTLTARVEQLEAELQPLWNHLGFRLTIPRANESARPRDWRPAYSDADAALIATLCAEDISRFGYSFDGLFTHQG